MKDWDYAKMSKSAHEAGGPEKFIHQIEEASRHEGQLDMLPWIGVGIPIGFCIIRLGEWGAKTIYHKIKEKRSKIQKDLNVAEEELLKNI